MDFVDEKMEISEIIYDEKIKYVGSNIAPIKCFLCDKSFIVGDESYLLFERRLSESNEEDTSMATVLSSAIGKHITELTAHSKVLCHACNEFVLEYEIVEQRYLQLKYKIIKDYNNIIEKYQNNLKLLESSISEIDYTSDIIECTAADDISSKEGQTPLDEQDRDDIFDYLLDKNFIEICPKIAKDDIDNLSNTLTDNLIKIDSTLGEEIDVNCFTDDVKPVENRNIKDDEAYYENIEKETDLIADKNTFVDEGDSNSLNFITDDNSSLKSSDLTNFGLELQKPKSENIRPSFLFDGTKFYCMLCSDSDVINTKEAFDFETITTHLQEKHDILLYVCSLCGAGFSKQFDLIDHTENTKCGLENGDVPYKKCNNFAINKIQKKNNQKYFECHSCPKKFTSEIYLDQHMLVHKSTKPFKCIVCSKDFASKYTLTSHTKIHTERKRPYLCSICNKSFLTVANLQQHNRTHSNQTKFVCDICKKSFTTQHNLEVHKIVHTGHKPFLCRTCGKSFARRAEITDHERTHTGEKPFACEICGMGFAQRSNLSTHKKSTHYNEKKHKCNTCEKSFKRRRLLDYHVKAAHTGERPYKCDVCYSTFVYPEHFKKHLRIHSGVKPYTCEVCGKAFNSRDNRNSHRFIHSDKKPYECLTCAQGFMRKPLLYSHMQSMGHYNDTIVVNQPRIKPIDDISHNDTEIQIMQDNQYKMVMDTKVMLMEDDDDEDVDEMILEEEHLVESIDSQDEMNNVFDDIENDNNNDNFNDNYENYNDIDSNNDNNNSENKIIINNVDNDENTEQKIEILSNEPYIINKYLKEIE